MVRTLATTQSRHPWRAFTRTLFAAVVALLPVLPELVDKLGIATVPVVASVLTVVGTATRILAMPAVETWLHQVAPWLAAQPDPALTPPPVPPTTTRWPQ